MSHLFFIIQYNLQYFNTFFKKPHLIFNQMGFRLEVKEVDAFDNND